MPKPFYGNIERLTMENDHFLKVLYTGNHQMTVMSLKPGEEIGEEVHDHDQFTRVEAGEAKAIVDGEEFLLKEDEMVIVPAGASHNIVNISDSTDLKLYTLYSSPDHHEGGDYPTKDDLILAEGTH